MLFRVGRDLIQGLIVIGCLSSATAQVARTADVAYPVKSPPLVDVPQSWAGFYLGGQVGYGMDAVRWRNLGISPFFSPPNSLTRDHVGGVIGGGQIGYNFQFNRIVLGIEGSVSAADFDRSFASPYFPTTDVWSSKVTWLSTATGRIGYSLDSWLPYIKGGLATGNVDTSIANNAAGAFSQSSAVHYGWTLGGGVEVKITPKLSLGLEFMHTDLGRSNNINGPQTTTATGAPIAGTAESYGVGLRSNSFMARLNYLFGR
jgi:outer membrane immunogenic protein